MSNDFGEFLESEGNMTYSISQIMQKVFIWMFVGVLATGITAFFVSTNQTLIDAIFGNMITLLILSIAEIALVLILTKSITKMSYTTAIIGFIAYAIINGLTLSIVFLLYELPSISNVFFITAGMFGLMALVGYRTNIDLSRIGNILLMGLIGIIIASVVNVFILNDTFSLLISVVGVIVFIGLTAYDVQKIKNIAQNISAQQVNNIAIIGALTLYLDFINLLLKLLRIFGRRKN